MKRKFILSFIVIAVIAIFVAPAHAIFCLKCGTELAEEALYCTKCGVKLERLEGKNVYDQSCELFRQEEYDQVISLLEIHYVSNPGDIKAQLLLAKAYLEKCDLLKQQGDKSYKVLVGKPYEIGKKIHLSRDHHLPEALSLTLI